jgi:protein O-GlcNAc transferase
LFKKKLFLHLIFSYVNLAAALTSINDSEGAIKAHIDALTINQNLYGVRSDLGNIFKSLGRLDDAEVCNLTPV